MNAMRRVLLLSIISALVISLAAPVGAVFALEGTEGEDNSALAAHEEVDVAAESEIVAEDVPQAEGIDATDVVEAEAAEGPTPELTSESDEPPVVSPPNPPVVVPPAVPLPVSPLLIAAYKATGAHMHAVQLYNNSSNMVSLEGFSLLYVAGDSDYEVPLTGGWIEPRSYMIMAWEGESEYADIEFRFSSVGSEPLKSVALRHSGYEPLVVSVPTTYKGELLHRFKSSAGNYTTNMTFATGESVVSGGGLYVLPDVPDISILEILISPRACTYASETSDCYDYVKVRNDGAEPLDLSRYRVRSGFSNTNSTATNTSYFTGIIEPGETVALFRDRDGARVSFSANDGTLWLEDIYGYEAYDMRVSPYIGSDLAVNKGRSWAYNSETEQWQWATPSPDTEANNFTVIEAGRGSVESPRELVPCGENQYRSEETNRCRNNVVVSGPAPCREGQYRSEETNRCRSIATAAAAVLKPCGDGEFRNPETNRCKKIASSEDIALADCGEGRERNPLTNRCRNVAVAGALTDTMPFPVEKTTESTERFAGWWTLGIVVLLGAGYGMWEWREELLGASKKVSQFLRSSK